MNEFNNINWAERINSESYKPSAEKINIQEKTQGPFPIVEGNINWAERLNNLKEQEVEDKIKANKISYSDMSWGNAIAKGLNNLPQDIVPYYQEEIDSLIEFITSPREVSKNFIDLSKGVLKLGSLRMMSEEFNMPLHEHKLLRDNDMAKILLIEKELVNNFATEENLKKMIVEEPARTINMLMGLMIPTAKLANLKKVEKLASMYDPINIAKQVSKVPVWAFLNMPGINKIPQGLMRRALFLRHTVPPHLQDKLVDIALKNATTTRMGKYVELQDQLEEFRKVVKEQISKAPKVSLKVDEGLFGKGSHWEKARQAKFGISIGDVDEAFDEVKKNILKNNEKLGRKALTLEEAQKMKVNMNIEFDKQYDILEQKIANMGLVKDAGMAVSKTLKSFLEEFVPETSLIRFNKINQSLIKQYFPRVKKLGIDDINEIQGATIELRNTLEKVISELRVGSLFDFQLTAKTATGASIGTALSWLFTGQINKAAAGGGAIAGLAFAIMDSSPYIKSALANYVRTLQKVGIKVRPTATLARMGIYQAGDYLYTTSEDVPYETYSSREWPLGKLKKSH